MNKEKGPGVAGFFKSGPGVDFALVIMVFALFGRTLGFDFVWDDIPLLERLAGLYGREGLGGVAFSEFMMSKPTGYFRPVPVLSLLFDQALFGKPWFFHLVNVSLHALNAVLLRRLLSRLSPNGTLVFLAAAIFALHPAQVEAVAFISSRTDLWAFFFCLSALNLWAGGLEGGGGRLQLGAASFCLFFGLLSKENAYFFPVVLLAFDYYLKGGLVEALKRGAVYALPALGVSFLLRSLASVGFGGGGVGLDFSQVGPVYGKFLKLLLLPWPLNSYYSPEQVSLGLGEVFAIAAFAALFACAWFKGNRRLAILGLGWLLFMLLPVSTLFSKSGAALAERFLYVPSAGALILLVSLSSVRLLSLERVLRVGGLVLALLAAVSFQRTGIWKNNETLFRSMVETSTAALGPYELGNVYMRRGDLRGAGEQFQKAVEILPGYLSAYLNLGVAYHKQGLYAEALSVYGKAAENIPEAFEPHYNAGNTFLAMGRPRDAVRSFARVVEIDPSFARGWNNLGVAYLEAGDSRLAAKAFSEALRIEPGYGRALENLNRALQSNQ